MPTPKTETFRASFEGYKMPRRPGIINYGDVKGPFVCEVYQGKNDYGTPTKWHGRMLPTRQKLGSKSFDDRGAAQSWVEGLFERKLDDWREYATAVTVQGGLF